MASIYWLGTTNDWSVGSNWSSGSVPGGLNVGHIDAAHKTGAYWPAAGTLTAGTVNVDAGGQIDAGVTHNGVAITLNGGTINGGTFTESNNFILTTGTLAGGTFSVGGIAEIDGGTVNGGSIVAATNGVVFAGGTINNLTLAATLIVQWSTADSVINGLTVTGKSVLGDTEAAYADGEAAKLAEIQAEVTAKAEYLDGDQTIAGISGDGMTTTTLLAALAANPIPSVPLDDSASVRYADVTIETILASCVFRPAGTCNGRVAYRVYSTNIGAWVYLWFNSADSYYYISAAIGSTAGSYYWKSPLATVITGTYSGYGDAAGDSFTMEARYAEVSVKHWNGNAFPNSNTFRQSVADAVSGTTPTGATNPFGTRIPDKVAGAGSGGLPVLDANSLVDAKLDAANATGFPTGPETASNVADEMEAGGRMLPAMYAVKPDYTPGVNAAGQVAAVVADKTGFKLASDGLDSVAITEPSGDVSAWNFRQRLVWLVRRLLGKVDKVDNEIKVYGADGETVLSIQTATTHGGDQYQGEAE